MLIKEEIKLVIDTPDDVRVDPRPGKLMYNGEIKPLLGQKGVSCTIVSRARLRIFFGKTADKSENPLIRNGRETELILKPLKKVLTTTPLDRQKLLDKSLLALEKLGYDPYPEIFKNPHFIRLKKQINEYYQSSYSSAECFNLLSIHAQAFSAYGAALNIIDQRFGFIDLNWKISDGFEGLQDALREHGQLIFQGTYGRCFYNENPKPHPSETTLDRRVYFFNKQNLMDSHEWTHGVIVEQAKIVNGKPCVFFRDPYDASIPGNPRRQVYLLSYDSFVERISDKYGDKGDIDCSYGLVLAK